MSARVLVVANRTASTPALLKEVEARAHGGAQFSLLIPPDTPHDHADWSLADAVGLLERACGGTVDTVDAGPNSADTIHRVMAAGDYDQVIVSTPEEHHRLWFHHDLPSRLTDLGVPVAVIPPEPHKWGPIEVFPPDWVPHAASPGGIAGLGNY
jgi:hypothetical protein